MTKINCNKLKKKESIELKEEFYNFVEQCFNEEISEENLILTEDLANKFVKNKLIKYIIQLLLIIKVDQIHICLV